MIRIRVAGLLGCWGFFFLCNFKLVRSYPDILITVIRAFAASRRSGSHATGSRTVVTVWIVYEKNRKARKAADASGTVL
ncbi:hypothetical protein DFH94DRAFT_353555 [Russula ochroleuca]|jgi:hypothetical protein|uniref:Uncharacterized protein n=1 Tax=Russula ochroleuca TaxID=152965 RepID=A0A9P5JWI9_9AGAM|nr:hypothetical protein DFH94DRAFT_353555 [Russula ochroleuca]